MVVDVLRRVQLQLILGEDGVDSLASPSRVVGEILQLRLDGVLLLRLQQVLPMAVGTLLPYHHPREEPPRLECILHVLP